MADHGQPVLRHGGVLRRRQSGRAHCGSRPPTPETRLRLRRTVPHAVRDRAPRRRGQKPGRHHVGLCDINAFLKRTPMATRAFAVVTCVCIAAFSAFWPVAATSPHFYRDDPITREPESQDASRATPSEIGDLYEMTYNLFVQSGYKSSGLRAQNLNTIDEVPDSSWFTNRIGTKPLSLNEIVRGPIVGAPPDPSRWVIVRQKASGVHPG